MPDKKCPECEESMNHSFSTVSGNAKYITWQCPSCGRKEMQCTGVLPTQVPESLRR